MSNKRLRPNLKLKKKVTKGSFLIEILITLSIIAILSISAFILALPQITKAKDAVIKEQLIQIRNALMIYSDDSNGCFPDSLPTCHADFVKGNTIYFKNFPCDPNGNQYAYQTDAGTCHKWFKVLANLGNKNDKSIDAIGCQKGCGKMCDYNYGISSTNVSLNEGCPVTPKTYYACAPNGNCIIYANPAQSQCPATFLNDPTCQNQCSKKEFKCHDESGKQN